MASTIPDDPANLPGASLTRSAFWLMLGKTIGFAFTFALPVLLVRLMSQKDFGLYKQTFLVLNTAITVLPLGFTMSAFYFLPREAARTGEVVLNIFLFYVFIGLGAASILIVRPEMLAAVFNAADLVEYAPLIGAVVFVWVSSSFFEFVAVANGEAPLAAAFLVTAHFARALLLTAAAVLFTSLRALLFAALVHGVLQVAALLVYLCSRFPGFWRRFDVSLMRSQLAYALPLGLAGFVSALQMDLPHYFVSNHFGPAVYAIYAVGCFQVPFLGIIRESVGSVMIARVSDLQKRDERREMILLISRMMRKLAAVFFPSFFFLLVSGRELLLVLFTAQYLDSWPVFAIHLAMIPVGIITSASDSNPTSSPQLWTVVDIP